MVMKMNQSYWQKTVKMPECPIVNTDLKADIVIIGAGMAGVSLAYQLKDLPYRVIVVEKDMIGYHTSGHTTGKLTVLHGINYDLLNKYYDIHYAYLYYLSNVEALETIKSIIEKEHIECDFCENEAYLYTNDPQYVPLIQDIEQLFHAFHVETLKDPQYLESIGLKHQAVFHPLKYIKALVEKCQESGVDFYEHSQVERVIRNHNNYILDVNHKQIECQYVVHATRYPFIKKGMFFAKIFQTKENIDYRKQNGKKSLLSVDIHKSYRPVKDSGLYIDQESQNWYALDSVPLRGVPYIGEIKPDSKEYVIYGFQKWGMTLSQVAATLIKDLILKRENAYKELYSCQYFSFSFLKEYQRKIMNHYYMGFIKPRFDYLTMNEIHKEEGGIVRYHGKLLAIYMDKQGLCHVFSPYCPHMKCIIQFDKKNKIWICPCHQSTYDVYGRKLDGPSLKSLKKKKI